MLFIVRWLYVGYFYNMKKVSFRLTARKEDAKESGVELDFSNNAFKNNRFKYGCGVTVLVSRWNPETQRVIGLSKINDRLDLLGNELLSYVGKNAELTKEGLKEHLDNCSGVTAIKVQTKINKEPYFQEWATEHIQTNRARHKHSTVTTKMQTVNLLNHFQPKIKFKDFDVNLFDSFVKWLKSDQMVNIKGKQKEKNAFTHNSVWKQSKEIKTLLRYADIVEELNVNSDYKKGLFNMDQIEVDNIYLNEDQLKKLADIDLSDQPTTYARARDMFLFGCWTGFRYSDMRSFTLDDIVEMNGKTRIKKKQQKGGKEVFIPLLKQVKPYLKEHTLSNPELNEYIKKVAELAELEDAQLIVAHTSRRSFASNLYRANVPMHSIMRLTGHKKVSTFLRYVKITPEEHAELTEQHSYFD